MAGYANAIIIRCASVRIVRFLELKKNIVTNCKYLFKKAKVFEKSADNIITKNRDKRIWQKHLI